MKIIHIFSGEVNTSQFIHRLRSHVGKRCDIWNVYGPAEATMLSTMYLTDPTFMYISVSIGTPLPNYQCKILDKFWQSTVVNQEGELFVGGVGVFAGYLGRNDLTEKAVIHIDGELFYRTGDLVRIDNNGLLHYQGRKDHQVKLHGQRIELGEIERCLLNISSISACVVIKWGDDHLVAYVQTTSNIDDKQLREYCQSHLPPRMIPSIFMILDKLSLNANGKVDRKLLPSPQFSYLSSRHLTTNINHKSPTNEIEVKIHSIWCDLFQQNQISTNTNIFTIGGHSLLIMQLFYQYKTKFHLETNTLSIADLFQYPTIIDHAKLIHQTVGNTQNSDDHHWYSLHLTQGTKHLVFITIDYIILFYFIVARASFAQERIFLDEQIRFSSKTNHVMYVIPLIYRLSSSTSNHLSIIRLCHAFQHVIKRHSVLRAALYFDSNGTITQRYLDAAAITDNIKPYRFSIINLVNDDRGIEKIINEILNQSDLFHLSEGHVINCQILRPYRSSHLATHDDDLLTSDDLILFTIHHAVFDGTSTSIFIRDLSLAYENNCSLSMNDNTLQYIDYSVHEHLIDMTSSRDFWHSELEGYNLEHPLPLPFDRHRLSSDERSGLGSTAQIIFDDEISMSFLNYASLHHLTLFQLGLATFYIFLFKLTHGLTDLCIASVNANRYRNELQNLIGMFVATLPYRIQLDSHWTFDKVVKHVREKCLSILEHSHYSLQHILADNHLNQSNVSFLETMFGFITESSNVDQFSLNGECLEQVSKKQSYEMAKFDFSVTFVYNPTRDKDELSGTFVCSRDLFEEMTVKQMAKRFQHLFEQVFSTKLSDILMDESMKSIDTFSGFLPEEIEELQSVVFHRLPNIDNEGMFTSVDSNKTMLIDK